MDSQLRKRLIKELSVRYADESLLTRCVDEALAWNEMLTTFDELATFATALYDATKWGISHQERKSPHPQAGRTETLQQGEMEIVPGYLLRKRRRTKR